MNNKKKVLLSSVIFMLAPLTGCQVTSGSNNISDVVTSEETSNVKTNFEIVKEFMDSFSIPNKDAIIENIYLPKGFHNNEGVITWYSSTPTVITNEGHVTRSKEKDINVTLKAVATLGGTNETRYYDVVVKKVNEIANEALQEAVNNFVLLEDNTIDRDIMVLPRICDMNGVYITWETSDSKIIDLDGNVYRNDKIQNVKLTGTFTLDDERMTKEFNVEVQSKSDDEPLSINENDSRILRKIEVSSLEGIIAAISQVQPGDAIILQDGLYQNVTFNIKTSGTKEHPIFLFAKNPSKVKLAGESRIDILADYIIVANFLFTDGYPSKETGVVNLEGNNIRFTNNKILNYELAGYDYKWLSLTGKNHEIDHNIFDGKTTGGSLLTIWRKDLSSQNHYIHHNQFLNYQDAGGANGYETIRVGTSTYSQSDSNVLIENNLFENISGEIEIISIKSGRTIVRNNTFKTCKGLVTCRHGKNDLIENNSFFADSIVDTGGIRMYDGGHVIRNNYIKDVNTSSNTRGGIVIHSGVNIPNETTVMNLQWTPYNVLVENNTIMNSRNSILIGGKYNYSCKDVTLKNNLIVSENYAAIRFDKPIDNPTWIGNLFFAKEFLDSNSVYKNVEVPSWFSNNIPTVNYDENDVFYYNEAGAKNIIVIGVDATGTDY